MKKFLPVLLPLTFYFFIPAAFAQKLPVWLEDQVRQGHLTRQEAEMLNQGSRSTSLTSNPAAVSPVKTPTKRIRSPSLTGEVSSDQNNHALLDIYLAQLRTPGLSFKEVTSLQREAAPFLRGCAPDKLQEYQQALTHALNQARANQFTQQQDEAATERETQRRQQLAREEAERAARDRWNYPYPSNRYPTQTFTQSKP